MKDYWRRFHDAQMAASGQPILVGPWRSEVGFESLYWLPWLAAWQAAHQVPKERLIAISRGGAGQWYPAAQSVELYDYVPMEKVRKAMLADAQASGSIKQTTMTAWEDRLIPLIAHELGLRRYQVLHPSRMYQELAPWWGGTMGADVLFKKLRFEAMPVLSPPLDLPLPERFVAVGFYARPTWPLTEDIRAWVAGLVEGLARQIPIVLVESGLHADDHIPFPLAGDRVLSLKDYVTPQTNLAVQSAVIAKSQAFIGTYGGLMQLAIRLKKPSVGFYQEFKGTAYAHKALTEQLAVMQKTPCFIGTQESARMVKEVLQI